MPSTSVIVGRVAGSVQATGALAAGGGSVALESTKTAVQVPSYAFLLPPSPKQPDNKNTTNSENASSKNSAILNFIIRTPLLFTSQ
jgi:hypothetical protein